MSDLNSKDMDVGSGNSGSGNFKESMYTGRNPHENKFLPDLDRFLGLPDSAKKIAHRKDVNEATKQLAGLFQFCCFTSTAPHIEALNRTNDGSTDIEAAYAFVGQLIEHGEVNDKGSQSKGLVTTLFYDGNVDSLDVKETNREESKIECEDNYANTDDSLEDSQQNEGFWAFIARRIRKTLKLFGITYVGDFMEDMQTYADDIDEGDQSSLVNPGTGLRELTLDKATYSVIGSRGDGAVMVSVNGRPTYVFQIGNVVRTTSLPSNTNEAPHLWQNPNYTWGGNKKNLND